MPEPISRYSRAALILAVTVSAFPLQSLAQSSGRLRVEENFRLEPQGQVLGRLTLGSPVSIVSRQGNWLEVDVEGWMWEQSIQARTQGAWDLVVSAEEGENLRLAPAGTVSGRLERGTLLEEMSREPGWLSVRRRGWIWSPSVEEDVGTSDVAQATRSDPPQALAGIPPGFAAVPENSPVVLAAPGGDTLAVAVPGSDVQVVSREGNWARVRVEGWMWMPTAEVSAAVVDETAEPVTPEILTRDGDLHVGRVVSWTMQFISLERAEAVRTDFFEGEPFLLTKFGDAAGQFVYVALSTERLSEVRGLVPLELLRVTARVRKAASRLTGTPIVDLLAFERVPGAK